MVAHIYELEQKIDPGVPADTIIVNNDVGWEKGNTYLDSIDGAASFSGHIKVIHRENIGRSFGGYNRAFELYKNQYDYWAFTEDDILLLGNQYFKICIDAFEKQARTGFVAIQGLNCEFFDGRRRRHAHGGVGLTRKDVLEKVWRKFGALPHSSRHDAQTWDDIIRFGEVPFTNCIERIGYNLTTVVSPYPLYAYAYDHMRGKPSNYPEPIKEGDSITLLLKRFIRRNLAGLRPRCLL
jgi:hypothetical protein